MSKAPHTPRTYAELRDELIGAYELLNEALPLAFERLAQGVSVKQQWYFWQAWERLNDAMPYPADFTGDIIFSEGWPDAEDNPLYERSAALREERADCESQSQAPA